MRKIHLCPGKINIKRPTQQWYIPVNIEKYYCEACLKNYSDIIEQIQFNLEIGTKHHCDWNRDFAKSSLMISNVRISIVNPTTLYRYKVKKVNSTSIKVGIPDKTNYMIVIENCELDTDIRICVENIKHGDVDNTYYNKLKDIQIVKLASYASELMYDASDYDKNVITFQISKLVRQSNNQYYKLIDNPFNVQIELVTDNSEIEQMNNTVVKYEKTLSEIKKIIIIDDCI